MRYLIVLAALLGASVPAQAADCREEIWWSGNEAFQVTNCKDQPNDWYGWRQGRRVHFIEKRYGLLDQLWNGEPARSAYDVNGFGGNCEGGAFRSMECD